MLLLAYADALQRVSACVRTYNTPARKDFLFLKRTHQKPALHPRHFERVSSDSEPTGQTEGSQPAYVSIRIRQHTLASAYVWQASIRMRQHTSACVQMEGSQPACVSMRMRQHTCGKPAYACVSIRQHACKWRVASLSTARDSV